MKKLFLSFAIAAVVWLPGALSGNTISAPTQTFYSVDWTSAGVGGVRDISPIAAHIALSGVNGSVIQALLFWHGPTNTNDPNANATISFNGVSITGQNIGLSSDNCWGYANSQAYRADVTSLVTGNGTYPLANFRNASANINGFSLIVFYDDGNPNNNRDVVLYQGNDSNIANSYDALGWNVLLSGINYVTGTANLQLHVSDGQIYPDGPLYVNGIVIDNSTNVFPGTTVPDSGTASSHNGGLWDIKTYNVTSFLTPSPPPDSLRVTIGTNSSDCLSLIVALIDLPAAAAPPPPCAIECPTNMVIPGGIPLNVTVQLAGTCNSNEVVQIVPPNGTVLPPGTNTVTVQLLSPTGTVLDRCQFTVTVQQPVAHITRIVNSKYLTTKYYQLTATDPLYVPSALKLYVTDSANTAFVAGPFSSGSIVQFVTGATDSAAPGVGLVKAIVTVTGSAEVWAVDPAGVSSALVVVP